MGGRSVPLAGARAHLRGGEAGHNVHKTFQICMYPSPVFAENSKAGKAQLFTRKARTSFAVQYAEIVNLNVGLFSYHEALQDTTRKK